MGLYRTSESDTPIRKRKGAETNPCIKEQELSLQCLDINKYDREACFSFFENYRVCRAFWLFVHKERRRKGIKPYLPAPEERAAVKQEYMPYFKR